MRPISKLNRWATTWEEEMVDAAGPGPDPANQRATSETDSLPKGSQRGRGRGRWTGIGEGSREIGGVGRQLKLQIMLMGGTGCQGVGVGGALNRRRGVHCLRSNYANYLLLLN